MFLFSIKIHIVLSCYSLLNKVFQDHFNTKLKMKINSSFFAFLLIYFFLIINRTLNKSH